MPYSSLADANPAIRGIRPKVTLAQANEIARIADGIMPENPDGAWAIAIFTFKRKLYTVRAGKWVKRKHKVGAAECADELWNDEGPRDRRIENHMADMDSEIFEGWVTMSGGPVFIPDDKTKVYGTYKTKGQAHREGMKLRRKGIAVFVAPSIGHKSYYVYSQKENCDSPELSGTIGMTELEDIMSEELAEVMKTVDGEDFPASDFLVVENPDEPSTWHLQVKSHGKPDHALMGAAKAALTSPGGHRGNKYEGPQKEKAISKLKALYKSEEMLFEAEIGEAATYKSRVQALIRDAEAIINDKTVPADVRSAIGHVRNSLRKTWSTLAGDISAKPASENGYEMATASPVSSFQAKTFADFDAADAAQDRAREVSQRLYQYQNLLANVFSDPTIDDKVAAIKELSAEFIVLVGELMGSPTEPMESDTAELDMAESVEGATLGLEIAEGDTSVVPLTMRVKIIKPGFGNQHDNNFYPADVLKRDAGIFVGAKMFETDHREGEKSTRTWVSTIQAIDGFTDDGAPIGKVVVHDPGFAERVKALDKAGLLHNMECSILGRGAYRESTVEGKKANVIESLKTIRSVDWVTRAGAGGHALNISESEGGAPMGDTKTPPAQDPAPEVVTQETKPAETPIQEQKPIELSEVEIDKLLSESNLPTEAKDWLKESKYPDASALKEAIVRAGERVKAMTGSGKPWGLGNTQPAVAIISETEHNKRLDDIDRQFGLR